MAFVVDESLGLCVGQMGDEVALGSHLGFQREDEAMGPAAKSGRVRGVRLGGLQGCQGHAVEHVGVLVEGDVDHDALLLLVGVDGVQVEEGVRRVRDLFGLAGGPMNHVKHRVAVAMPAHRVDDSRTAQDPYNKSMKAWPLLEWFMSTFSERGSVDCERLLDENDVVFRDGKAVHVARLEEPTRPRSRHHHPVGEGLAVVVRGHRGREPVDDILRAGEPDLDAHREHVPLGVVVGVRPVAEDAHLLVQVHLAQRGQVVGVDLHYEGGLVEAKVSERKPHAYGTNQNKNLLRKYFYLVPKG